MEIKFIKADIKCTEEECEALRIVSHMCHSLLTDIAVNEMDAIEIFSSNLGYSKRVEFDTLLEVEDVLQGLLNGGYGLKD